MITARTTLEQSTLAIVSPVCVAILGGLTFLAYKHPESFRKLYNVLSAITLGALIGLAAYGVALDNAGSAASTVTDHDTAIKVVAAITSIRISIYWYYAGLAFIVYITFLSSFPIWIDKPSS